MVPHHTILFLCLALLKAGLKGGLGTVGLDLDLLKQFRVLAVASQWQDWTLRSAWCCVALKCISHWQAPPGAPVSTNQTSWVDRRNYSRRAWCSWQTGPNKWSVPKLKDILHRHFSECGAYYINGRVLCPFRCLEWESEIYRVVMQSCFYPFNMPKHHYHHMNNIQIHHMLFIQTCKGYKMDNLFTYGTA